MPAPHHAQLTVLRPQFTLTATIGGINHPPEFTQQPPLSAAFRIGTAVLNMPFGTVVDADSDPIVAALSPIPSGFTLTLVGNQLYLSWSGTGTEGVYPVRVIADDGV